MAPWRRGADTMPFTLATTVAHPPYHTRYRSLYHIRCRHQGNARAAHSPPSFHDQRQELRATAS